MSGEQLSVGVKMEACGDEVATANNQFCCQLGGSQAGNLVITNIEQYNWQGQTEFT